MKTNDTNILSRINTLSDEEFNVLMANSSDFAEEVNQIKNIYHLFDNLEAQKSIDIETAWNKHKRKARFDKAKHVAWNFSRNAAAILLPLFLLLQYVVQPLLKESSPQEIITLSSAPGIVTKAVLPDGSEVWLNSQSKLTYPRQFTGNDRNVELEGEAYFKVVSDDKNRFNVVTSDKTFISAFGTEFNVDTYNEDPQHTITLAKGSLEVSLYNQTEKQRLMPGQKAIINPDRKSLSILDVDTYVETAWKDGKMVFRREKINNIAQRLARRFGVSIDVKGDISDDYQFTATFTNESLEDILELLKLSNSIDYSISTQKKLPNNTFSQRTVTLVCK